MPLLLLPWGLPVKGKLKSMEPGDDASGRLSMRGL